MSSSSGKTSAMSDSVFPTDGNPAVLKGTSNVKRPLIEDQPNYSEDEVRKLLNKG
jgi:hypothetical protein